MRYAAILIQFGVVVLISRRAAVDVAGLYFIIYGWINVTYFLAGLGIPDGLVREVSAAIGSDERDRVWPLVYRGSAAFAAISLAMAGIGAVGAIALGLEAAVALPVAIWWLCYATTFHCAQCLVALDQPEAGSFFYYPAPTLALLASLVPYLVLAEHPPITGIIVAAIIGAVPVALWAGMSVLRALRRGDWPRNHKRREPLGAIVALGFKIAVGRAAITVIYWVPTWLAGLTQGAAAASILGLSSRLNNSVAAVMSAIRFIARPQIVAAAGRDDWPGIERSARLISTVTTLTATLCLLVYLVIGEWAIETFFGVRYAAVYPVLAVLLIGNIAEACGGVVDEILKMTGAARFFLFTLLGIVIAEVSLGLLLDGMVGLALAQTLSLIALYGICIGYARVTRGVLIVPFFVPGQLVEAFRRR